MSLTIEHLDLIRRAKKAGFSDQQISQIFNRNRPEENRLSEADVRQMRQEAGLIPVFKSVDTCAGEFEAFTPYFYSTYERSNESVPSDRKKIMILGGGPNRIGQGIEFDYCCVQAVFALKELGFETIMVNSNPETVSTDYDTADKLYFEPLTIEDVLAICQLEKPDGVIVQLGGQTPLKLASGLENAGVPILGTSPDSIDLAEDRDRFGALLNKLDIPQPENGSGRNIEEVFQLAKSIGYPVMVRPSYVLGGRAMQTVYNDAQLAEFTQEAIDASNGKPILVDKFLQGAIEVDVDAICDGDIVVICAIMEHIEEAGIHSGDSACIIPPRRFSETVLNTIREYTDKLGKALSVRGLMNIQYVVQNDKVYVIEVNPRASRTVPFVSKAIGIPFAKIAAKVMAGEKLADLGLTEQPGIDYFAVKEAVLPFHKFPGCIISLGPEMRSTGEVMGIDEDFGMAFAKSQMAAGTILPLTGDIFVSLKDLDKAAFIPMARELMDLGFNLIATAGTSKFLTENGIENRQIFKISEGRPNVWDMAMNQEIGMIINTFSGAKATPDENKIRSVAVHRDIPLITTLSAVLSVIEAIRALQTSKLEVAALQDYHERQPLKIR